MFYYRQRHTHTHTHLIIQCSTACTMQCFVSIKNNYIWHCKIDLWNHDLCQVRKVIAPNFSWFGLKFVQQCSNTVSCTPVSLQSHWPVSLRKRALEWLSHLQGCYPLSSTTPQESCPRSPSVVSCSRQTSRGGYRGLIIPLYRVAQGLKYMFADLLTYERELYSWLYRILPMIYTQTSENLCFSR